MTAAKTDFLPADAPSHESVTWHAIDWRKTLGNVRRLQARIVKATQGVLLRPHGDVREA